METRPVRTTTREPSEFLTAAEMNVFPTAEGRLLPTLYSRPEEIGAVERLGQRYIPTSVPKGLPRYRAMNQCYRNACRAATDDPRLRYVEGLALQGTMWIGHAWVTMDGEHAIDPTWRGQLYCGQRIDPAAEYFGVEIPIKDVWELWSKMGSMGLIAGEWAHTRQRP